MVRASTPHEWASHENSMKMQDDGKKLLHEFLPQLEAMLADGNREWGSALTYRDFRVITRIEFASVLLATGQLAEYELIATPDGSWNTFSKEHGKQVYEKADSLLKSVV